MQTQEREIQRAVAKIRREKFSNELSALRCDQRIHLVGGCNVMRLIEGFFIFGKTRSFVGLVEATDVLLRAAALRGTGETQ